MKNSTDSNIALHTEQTSIHTSEIGEYITFEDCGKIILAIGPCRVGSKVQLFMMAASGYPSFEQPIKAILRCRTENIEPDQCIVDADTTYIKETLGPYSQSEIFFDPIRILEQKQTIQWTKEHLNLVFLIRNPLDTWQSWKKLWANRVGEQTLYKYFSQAYKETKRLYDKAQSENYESFVFDYGRNKSPESTYSKFFNRLELTKRPIVSGWQNKTIRKRIKNNIQKFNEPEIFLPDGIYETIDETDEIKHFCYETHDDKFTEDITETIFPIYSDIKSNSI